MLMSETFETSNQASLPDIANAISSPASADGATRCDSQDGLTTGQCGPAPALANLSARQAKAMDLMTSGTYGRRGSTSSESAALASSLVSRLRQRLNTDGSILFNLTWKQKATPSLRSVYLLRASARRTFDNGCGSWPTPIVNATRSTHCYGKNKTIILKLPGVAKLASWPTPSCTTGLVGQSKRKETGRSILIDAVMLASGPTQTGSRIPIKRRGQLNPAHSRWLMGYPAAWDACAPTATQSSRIPRPS